MKRICGILFCAILFALSCPAGAEGAGDCVFPDLSDALGTQGVLSVEDYAYAKDFVCDVYLWPMPEGWDSQKGLELATLAQSEEFGGWSWDADFEEQFLVFRLTDASGRKGMLFPNYSGGIMLLVPPDCDLVSTAPPTPEPTETPAPSPEPSSADASPTVPPPELMIKSYYETVDCPNCLHGECQICYGRGYYSLPGFSEYKTDCDPYCSMCKGTGTYQEHRTAIWKDGEYVPLV